MAYVILERATARVQHYATRGNFKTFKPKKGPKFFRGEKAFFLRHSGAAPEFLPLRINKKGHPLEGGPRGETGSN